MGTRWQQSEDLSTEMGAGCWSIRGKWALGLTDVYQIIWDSFISMFLQ
jgi:hypothetical protein